MQIEDIIKKNNVKAVIFDIDGTLIDNNAFHLQSWLEYLKRIGKDISTEEFNANMSGRTTKYSVEYVFQKKMDDTEAMKYILEKESIYRELYKPFISPIPGLLKVLQILSIKNIPMAIATSGIEVNIDFLFENISIEHYFQAIVSFSHVKNCKPHPEIYLRAAELLNVHPENCLAFEDAPVGIKSAKDAGMHVVGITTGHTADELQNADFIIEN